MKLPSLFKHFKYRTKYITIPTEVSEHPRSPLRGLDRAVFRIFFVDREGNVVDPSRWETVDRIQTGVLKIDSFAILLIYEPNIVPSKKRRSSKQS